MPRKSHKRRWRKRQKAPSQPTKNKPTTHAEEEAEFLKDERNRLRINRQLIGTMTPSRAAIVEKLNIERRKHGIQ